VGALPVAELEGLWSRYSGLNGPHESIGIGDRAENASLHFNHLNRGLVISAIGGSGAIRQQQTLEPAIVGFAHGCVDTHVGGNARKSNILDAFVVKEQFEVGGVK